VLTDAEVDRRFSMLVADLKAAVGVAEWPVMRAPEPRLPDDVRTRRSAPCVPVAERITAVASALLLAVVGALLAATGVLAVGLVIAWFVLVVPGATLATTLVVDRLRRAGRDTRR
jgi:hypothetical protein